MVFKKLSYPQFRNYRAHDKYMDYAANIFFGHLPRPGSMRITIVLMKSNVVQLIKKEDR